MGSHRTSFSRWRRAGTAHAVSPVPGLWSARAVLSAMAVLTILVVLAAGPGCTRQSEDRPDIRVDVTVNCLYLVENGPGYLQLHYRWRPGPQFEAPYADSMVFAHFVDGSGQIIVQNDHTPVESVNDWTPGEPVIYERLQVIPHFDGTGGRFPQRLLVGLFDRDDPSRKQLLMDLPLHPADRGESPRLVALAEAPNSPPPDWDIAPLAARLLTADIRLAGSANRETMRLVTEDQFRLARSCIPGGHKTAERNGLSGNDAPEDNAPAALGILSPAGTAVDFALWLQPWTELVFTPRAESKTGFRVTFQRRGGSRQTLMDEVLSGRGTKRSLLLNRNRGGLAWVRLENSGPGDGVWESPRLAVRPAGTQRDRYRRQLMDRLRRKARNWNVLLVILDAARADALSCYGSPRQTTPALDRFVRQCSQFTHVTANAPYTSSSTASLFTGMYPDAHGVLDPADRLSEQLPHLAASFLGAGFTTAAVTASPFISHERGTGRGFLYLVGNYKSQDVIRAHELNRCLELIRPHLAGGDSGRYFLYLHYLEPHSPYAPPAPFVRRFTADPGPEGIDGSTETLKRLDSGEAAATPEALEHVRALYDANLLFADLQLARALAAFRREGLLERTLVLIMSDHGEAFGEHGRMLHNSTVFGEMIRIPLLIHFPIDDPSLRMVSHRTLETVDVNAFLRDLFRLHSARDPIAYPAAGRSFLPLFTGRSPHLKELTYSLGAGDDKRALANPMFKQVFGPAGPELFNLHRDPGERSAIEKPQLLPEAQLRQTFLHQLLVHPPCPPPTEADPASSQFPAGVDAAEMEQLRLLGYVE